MRLLLIRHGQTPGNVLGQLDTAHPGPGLTELGERQAEALARSLARLEISRLYASTLIRTQLTAAPLAGRRGLDVTVLDGLHEIEAGALEKLTDRESHLRYLGTVFGWAAGELDRRMPTGPSGHDFLARFDDAVARIAAAATGPAGGASPGVTNDGGTDDGGTVAVGTVAVVSHGAAIRVWTALRAENVDAEFAARHVLANTGIVALEGGSAEGWRMVHWDGSPVGGLALADPTAEDPAGGPA